MNYLSRTQVAQRIGVKPGALSRYKLPPPDATIGDVRGWTPATIDQWHANRPGQGARTDLKAPTDELYLIAKERAEGKRPNVPWRQHETDTQRRARWNKANPHDPIPPQDPGKPTA